MTLLYLHYHYIHEGAYILDVTQRKLINVSCLQTILASGVTLSLFAASAVIKTRAAAPSFSVLALAAVTVPEKEETNQNQVHIKKMTDQVF